MPDAPKLSLYLLRVTGLPAGEYRIGVNGQPAGTRTAAELEAGSNLATLDEGVFAERAKTLYALIATLENDFNRVWREANADALKITKTLETMDAARGTDAEKFTALLRTFNAEKLADAARKLEPRQVNEPQKLGVALVAIRDGQAADAEKLAAAKAALQTSKAAEAEKLAPRVEGHGRRRRAASSRRATCGVALRDRETVIAIAAITRRKTLPTFAAVYPLNSCGLPNAYSPSAPGPGTPRYSVAFGLRDGQGQRYHESRSCSLHVLYHSFSTPILVRTSLDNAA